MNETVKSASGRTVAAKWATARRYEIPAPGVLDGQRDAEPLREIAERLCLRQSADFADLEVDGGEAPDRQRFEERRHVRDDLVQDERERRHRPHRAALCKGRAGLLEVDATDVLDQTSCEQCVAQSPAAVRVGYQPVLVLKPFSDGPDARGVLERVAADLQLEVMDPLRAACGDEVSHLWAVPSGTAT